MCIVYIIAPTIFGCTKQKSCTSSYKEESLKQIKSTKFLVIGARMSKAKEFHQEKEPTVKISFLIMCFVVYLFLYNQ